MVKTGRCFCTLCQMHPPPSDPRSEYSSRGEFKNYARPMGADPTTSAVTGRRSTVELRPQYLHYTYFFIISKPILFSVSAPGVAPGTCTL